MRTNRHHASAAILALLLILAGGLRAPPPSAAAVAPPPGGREAGGEFGHAELTLTRDPRDPRVLVAKRTVCLDQSVIPPEKYPAWRAFIQRVDALMHKTVRIERGGK